MAPSRGPGGSGSPRIFSIIRRWPGDSFTVFDYNDDGKPDVYFVNGASIPELRKTDPKYYNRLYRNNGDGTFTDVTAQAGVAAEGYSMSMPRKPRQAGLAARHMSYKYC